MFKRALDLLASAAGLVLLAPLLALIALAIKLDSRGPVFFRQERVGLHGRLFRIFKFRTMTVEGEAPGGRQVTVAGDARITRVGTFLRRTKLDELPQLIDVLRGTMSLVGPRPEVPRYVAHYPPEWRDRLLSVRPGITDFASVRYHDENERLAGAEDPEREYVHHILPTKLRYALHYVDEPTLANDLRVLGLTLRTVAPSLPLERSVNAMNRSPIWPWLDQKMSTLGPRNRLYAMLADALIILGCWHFTYLFRLGFEKYQPGRAWYDDWVSLGVVIVYLVALAVAGVPRGPWRFFGFEDVKRIALSCFIAGLVCATAILLAQLTKVARAVLVLHPFFCILALSLVRMAWRMTWERAHAITHGQSGEPKRAIVLGAGDAARRLVSAIDGRDGWTILALLDDDPAKQRLRIGGVTVQGRLTDVTLPHILAGATHVIVAMPQAGAEERERAVQLAVQTGLEVMTLPEAVPVGGAETTGVPAPRRA
jgi:lipopolysaccharide/colanic/teichoic acid biosynthesis glycosyltransferase